MDYGLNEEQVMIRDLCRKIAKEKIEPKRAYYDETEEFPTDLIKVFAESDLFRLYIPEEYGGLGYGALELSIAIEELSYACAGITLILAGSALGTFPLLLFGNEEQKKKYLPSLAKGEYLAAFALTESKAGSDASAIETKAEKDGDSYIINGTKQWITNGGEAHLYTVIAMTNKSKGARGATAFLVEKGTEGFSFGKKEKKMGIRGSCTRELIFNNCRIPKENILGREGMGFIISMKTFDVSRPGVAAQALGIAQGAFDAALNYARTRVQFGKPISSFQAIQHTLADMATSIEAVRSLIYSTSRMIDKGVKNYSRESAMCKVLASDTAMKVTTEALQIFGGYGYMKDYPIEKMMRDAKITQIYEGTNQIQRNIIALQLIKESAAKK